MIILQFNIPQIYQSLSCNAHYIFLQHDPNDDSFYYAFNCFLNNLNVKISESFNFILNCALIMIDDIQIIYIYLQNKISTPERRTKGKEQT